MDNQMDNQREIDEYLDALISESELEIIRAYALRMKEIRFLIAQMYEKYSVNGELTLHEMSKYNRMEKQLQQMAEILNEQYKINVDIAQKTAEQVYLENYYRSAYLMEYQAAQSLGFGLLNQAAIEAAVTNVVAGLTIQQIYAKNYMNLNYKVRQEITMSLVRGEAYSQMARRIMDVLETDYKHAAMIARTEAGRCQSLGRLDSVDKATDKLDSVERVWDSTLDVKTRKSHQKLDQQKADKDGYFHSGTVKARAPRLFGVAKEDIQCRCSFRIVVNGQEPTVRRARNPKTGKNEVVGYMNYEEWFKTLK